MNLTEAPPPDPCFVAVFEDPVGELRLRGLSDESLGWNSEMHFFIEAVQRSQVAISCRLRVGLYVSVCLVRSRPTLPSEKVIGGAYGQRILTALQCQGTPKRCPEKFVPFPSSTRCVSAVLWPVGVAKYGVDHSRGLIRRSHEVQGKRMLSGGRGNRAQDLTKFGAVFSTSELSLPPVPLPLPPRAMGLNRKEAKESPATSL